MPFRSRHVPFCQYFSLSKWTTLIHTRQNTSLPIMTVEFVIPGPFGLLMFTQFLAGGNRERTFLKMVRMNINFPNRTENNVYVEFELPGISLEDISLTATDSTITLSSVKTMTSKELSGIYYLKERHFGSFFRKLTLPDHIDLK